MRDEANGIQKLKEKGWNGENQLILVNPCGAFSKRQWTEERYLGFAQMWLSGVDPQAKFVLLGYPALLEKTETLVQLLGNSCINLIGETSTMEAFNSVRRVNLILSDDGVLLQASWVNHVPTIAFLGALPSYLGRPLGPKSFGFTSEDIPCGNCHRMVCEWGDNRCLTRVTVEQAVEQAKILLGS